jgi:hypothetical protein
MMNYTGLRVTLSCSYHDFLASNSYNKISIFKETVVVVTTFFASIVCLLISKVLTVRRRNKFQQMSEFQRSGIIGIRECGFPLEKLVDVWVSIIHTIKNLPSMVWGRSLSTLSKNWMSITTNCEDRRLQYMTTRDKVQSTASVGMEWRRALRPKTSISTIYRRKTLLDYMLMALIGEFR